MLSLPRAGPLSCLSSPVLKLGPALALSTLHERLAVCNAEAWQSGWVFTWPKGKGAEFALASVAFLRPPATGPNVSCTDFSSLVPRLLSLKVTPPKPSNFGFKNHFDLIFYREHGRLSEFNLSFSLLYTRGGTPFNLTDKAFLKSLCLATDGRLEQNVKAGRELSRLPDEVAASSPWRLEGGAPPQSQSFDTLVG